MHLTLEFGGGLELLLEKSTKVHKVDVQPNGGEGKVMMKGLLSWVKSNLIKERPEMFLKGASVYTFRPPSMINEGLGFLYL
ncbi:ubiquitin-related modifier 1 homolog isoform X2 [Oryza brachyantha]|uniref:ubiquitin-related modifier 1 homolog isoform X2 n=1 Tax=Oryza brachyantha TaxID=4533 RepID=UPI00077618CB|nr:ubiquitin-related modifier 1 homolog isoform X2 [Oryza brachyantha]